MGIIFEKEIALKGENSVPKGVTRPIDIDEHIYYKLEYLVDHIYNAKMNRLITVASEYIIDHPEMIKPYPVSDPYHTVRKNIYFNKRLYQQLKRLGKQYHMGIVSIINIALNIALESEAPERFRNYQDPLD